MTITAEHLKVLIEADGAGKAGKDLDSVGDKSDSLISKFGKVGGAAGLVSGALAGISVGAALTSAVKGAGDLEQAVANISTIKPDIDTSAVFKSLNDMSTKVPQSAAQLGDALYNIFSSVDVSQKEALGLVETFAKGAVGAATDAGTFGTSILGVMNAYGLAASDASHISDVFFNTVNKGVITGQELASSLGPVTQSAKAAGVSLDELGGLMAGVTKEGGPASQNINNLNNFLQKVTTTDAQTALNKLGVATKTAAGDFRPITDVLSDLKPRLNNMTEAARANALQEIFPDAQARIGAATLLSQLDNVKAAIADNKNTTGSAAAAYEKMSATFNSQTTLLMNTFQSMLVNIGARILPAITPLITAFAKNLPAAFDAVGQALAPVGAAIQTFARYLTFAGTEGDALNDHLSNLPAAVQPIAQVFGEVVATVAEIFPTILSTVQTVIGGAVEFITTNWSTISGILTGALDVFRTYYAAIFQGLVEVVSTTISTITANWSTISGILSTVWADVSLAAKGALDGIMAVLTTVIDLVRSRWPEIKAIVIGVFEDVLPVVQRVFDDVWQVINGVIGFVSERWPRLKQMFTEVFDALIAAVKPVAEQVGPTLQSIVDIVERVVSEIGERWGQIEQILGPVIEGAVSVVKSALSVLSNVVQAAMKLIQGDWTGAWNNIKAAAGSLVEGIVTIIKVAIDILPDIVRLALGLVADVMSLAWEGMQKLAAAAWAGMQKAARAGLDLVIAEVKALPGQILAGLGALGGLLVQAGRDMIQGLIDGIKEKGKEAVSAAKGIAGDAIHAIASFGRSPWPATIAAGGDFGEGFAVGIYNKIPTARAAVGDLADEVIATLDQRVQDMGATGSVGINEFLGQFNQTGPAAGGVSLLAASMAAAVAPIDEYRAALYGAREQLADTEERIRALQRELANTKPGSDAAKAIKEQISALQSERSELGATIKSYEEMTATAVKGISALDGWNDAVNRTALSAANLTQYGAAGVGAINALNAAMLEDSPKAGAAAVAAINAATEAAHRAGVSDWQALGAEAMRLYGEALSERTPEAIQAALDATGRINDAVLARAPTIQSSLAAALSAAGIAEQVGSSWGSVFTAATTAIDAGAPLPVEAIGRFGADVLGQLRTLPAAMQAELGPAFDAAWQAFIINPSAEALSTLQGVTGNIHDALAIIPKDMGKLAPEIQAIIRDLVHEVDAGTLSITEGARMAGDAAKLIPAGFRNLLPEVQRIIGQYVNAVGDGRIGIERAVEQINDITGLIPKNLHELTPAIQKSILDIVAAWQTGALSIEEANRRIAAAAQAGADATKKAAEEAAKALAQMNALGSAGPSAVTHSSTGANGIQTSETSNYGDVPGLNVSTVTEPGQQPQTTVTYGGRTYAFTGTPSEGEIMRALGFSNKESWEAWKKAQAAARATHAPGGDPGIGGGLFGTNIGDVQALLNTLLGMGPPHASGGYIAERAAIVDRKTGKALGTIGSGEFIVPKAAMRTLLGAAGGAPISGPNSSQSGRTAGGGGISIGSITVPLTIHTTQTIDPAALGRQIAAQSLQAAKDEYKRRM